MGAIAVKKHHFLPSFQKVYYPVPMRSDERESILTMLDESGVVHFYLR